MKFLGIDLGWSSGPSGLCCLDLQGNHLVLQDLQHQTELTAILHWVDQRAPKSTPALVAVDAPTLIPNPTGMRLPDRLAHQHFGKYHAGCYPANLNRPFADRTVGVGLSLEQRGFAHAPTIEPQQAGRYQIEVFPHAAMIGLFGLPRILKYKKGRLGDRRSELAKLRQHILTDLPQKNPRLQITAEDLPEIPERGPQVKALEDQLDSLICAYIAAYWWVWGNQKNWVLGDRTTGYIVVPQGSPSNLEPT